MCCAVVAVVFGVGKMQAAHAWMTVFYALAISLGVADILARPGGWR
jgi:hypothetical protein